jgi:multiple antibiotic resistance protein
MSDLLTLFVNVFLKIFIILTPFFVMSAFLSLTKDEAPLERQRIAKKVALAVALSCLVLFLFGTYIFALFGITLDAFRIGAGAVLFISAVGMIQGKASVSPQSTKEDVAVVPLAIPITVGPGTIGALLVMGAGLKSAPEKIVAGLALLCAVFTVGGLLLAAGRLESVLGQQGLTILTKLTGLFVSAIAAQIFFTGLKNFLSG